ncbi:MAG: copper resistance protein CopC/CopD [Candidatus Dormibacteraeota bacterium]|nr:copper resistance protein CopC/CopD [Candidatus Dormibacteraeota bacterium]
MRAQIILGALVLVSALGAAFPAAASAHAYLVRTSPAASGVLDAPPATVALSFDEAVEPRFATISVSSAQGSQETTAAVTRSPGNPDTLIVPLRRGLSEGWYLVYWRAISVDGHPVQGAFTYAVGPNPGPAPQFAIPHLSATAVTPGLLVSRWVMFLSVMTAIGSLAMRLLVARSVVWRVPGASLRALSRAWLITTAIGLVAIPVYLDVAIANDSLRSPLDFAGLVGLYRVTAFGRGYLDLELCFALFVGAGAIALWVDRPERRRRSVAELAAGAGAAIAAAGVLFIPGAVGHAGQTAPRGLSVALDAVHLLSGSIWIGGLVGLLVLSVAFGRERRVPALSVIVPRFSGVALTTVLVLLATGTGATIVHMPSVDALWGTSYGVAILVKIGLLALAVALAAGNLLRTRPRLIAAQAQPQLGHNAARLLARLVGGEAILVTGAVFTAAVLSSLAPPPPAFALQSSALAHVGPGRVAATVTRAGYRLQVLVSPNRAAAPDAFALRITRGGAAVRGATVTLTFNHLQMEMPQQQYALREVSPGVYERNSSALIMVGPWSLAFAISPPGAAPFAALIVDQANG